MNIKQQLLPLLKTTKVQMASFLLIIAISGVFYKKEFSLSVYLLTIVLSAVGVDFLLTRLRRTPLFFLSAALVSGLIVSLIFSPNLLWYEAILAVVLAMMNKNFLRLNNAHIFNPAAFGLFLVSFIFHQSVSWWGVSVQVLQTNFVSLLLFIILLSPAYVSMIRLKRFRITFAFFIFYILLISIFQFFHHVLDLKNITLNTLLNPATVFFSIVMLPEPMTTPNNHIRQILFGMSVAVISILTGFVKFVFIPDPNITGLLIANALFFRFK